MSVRPHESGQVLRAGERVPQRISEQDDCHTRRNYKTTNSVASSTGDVTTTARDRVSDEQDQACRGAKHDDDEHLRAQEELDVTRVGRGRLRLRAAAGAGVRGSSSRQATISGNGTRTLVIR